MILDVPFIPSAKYYCAQACALMVLKYFYPQKEFDIEDIARKSVKHKKYGTTTIGLAKALIEYGLRVDFYCRSIKGETLNNEDNENYLKKYGDYILKEKEIKEKAKRLGVNIMEKKLTNDHIEKALKENRIVIPLVNWNVLSNNKGFQGHFIVISGFDQKYIFFHNPGPYHPEANKKARKRLMEKARSYKGTNKETIIAYVDQTFRPNENTNFIPGLASNML